MVENRKVEFIGQNLIVATQKISTVLTLFLPGGGGIPPPYMSFRHKSYKNDSIAMIFGNNYQLDVRKLSKKFQLDTW